MGCSDEHEQNHSDLPGGVPAGDNSSGGSNYPDSPGGGNIAEVQQFMIFHNLKRCWHDAPRLKWNAALAQAAKEAASQCSFKRMEASDSIAFGESLGQIKAQDDWYMEFLSYPYGKSEYPDSVGNFARMVWQDTTDFGCAHVVCGSKDVYYCRYAPPANPVNAAGKVKFLKSDFMKCNGTN
jgi:hypothetical protein